MRRRRQPNQWAVRTSLSHVHPIEAGRAAAGVVEFHVGSSAGNGGDRSPVRAEEAGGSLDDITLAGDAGPLDDTILACLGDGLIGRSAQNRGGIGRVGAGNILLPVAGT